jgi:hypothetical protein
MIIAYCVGVASMDMYEILRRMFVLEGRQRRARCYYTMKCYYTIGPYALHSQTESRVR